MPALFAGLPLRARRDGSYGAGGPLPIQLRSLWPDLTAQGKRRCARGFGAPVLP